MYWSLGTCLIVCTACSLAIPVTNEKEENPSQTVGDKVKDQEQALEELAALAANKVGDNVVVKQQKTVHYSNDNGKEEKETSSERKLVDSVNGNVVLDIKQKAKTDNSQGKPNTHTETEVDVPIDGIHKTFTNDGDSENINAIQDPSEQLQTSEDVFKFTPSTVAQYLFQTGEFEALNEALAEFVNTSVMTQEEADEYKDNVRREYNKLVQEGQAQENELNVEDLYPVLMDDADSYGSPQGEEYQSSYGYSLPTLDIEELQNQALMRDAIARKETLNSLIKDLLDEWLSRAVLTGDSEAGAMLSNIMSLVSRDDDPDDFKQVRQTLTDLFANEVLNSLQRRPIIPDDMALYDTMSYPSSPYMEETENQVLPDQIDNIPEIQEMPEIQEVPQIPEQKSTDQNDNDKVENENTDLLNSAKSEEKKRNSDKSKVKVDTSSKNNEKAKRSVPISEQEVYHLRM